MEPPLPHLELEIKLAISLVAVLATALLSWGIRRGTERVMSRFALPILAFQPVRVAIQYALYILTAVFILSLFGLKFLQGLLAIMATVVTLVAIGFVALWSILSNLLCTFILIITKPFLVGDEIEFPSDTIRGKVVDLSFVYTTLLEEGGAQFQIPNSMFFQKMFKRRRGEQRIDLEEQLKKRTA